MTELQNLKDLCSYTYYKLILWKITLDCQLICDINARCLGDIKWVTSSLTIIGFICLSWSHPISNAIKNILPHVHRSINYDKLLIIINLFRIAWLIAMYVSSKCSVLKRNRLTFLRSISSSVELRSNQNFPVPNLFSFCADNSKCAN